ncbi:hypothetical protein EJB05_51665, partial [Eragrostis curvula]
MEGSTGGVQVVSRYVILTEPAILPDGLPETMNMTPWDLQYISVNYIQKGVLLPKPSTGGTHIVDDLASSFARALGIFYPLAGRLAVAEANDDVSGHRLVVSLCCNNKGAEFVHATAPEVSVRDITAPLYIPSVLQSFFPLNGLLCGDAILESCPVLAAQVTELADGVFVAMSLNHAVADGTTFWHFFNTWSEINRNSGRSYVLSTAPPVLERWFPDTCQVPITLPFSKLEDEIRRAEFPPVQECFFHFSAESVQNLKAKANDEMAGTATATISSLQAVLAHIWRAACRARGLSPQRETTCLQPVGCRRRVKGVPEEYYMGSAVALGVAKSTVGQILDMGLGWTAWQLNQAVTSFDEARTREMLMSWHQKPSILYLEASMEPADIIIAGSPRFDVYGNDFGWGRPVTARSGAGNKMDGVLTVYEGVTGRGSMAVEMCLSPDALAKLSGDREFQEMLSNA